MIQAGDHQINTIKMGSGSPLVMLHGFAAGLAFWVSNFEPLAKNHTIYAIDLPGFGRSSRVAYRGSSIKEAEEYFVLTLEEWRKAVKIKEKFTLMGK
jgi:pimeloyl-ACP methyl ester carboxylesterase